MCTPCALQAAAKKEKMDKDDEERIQEAIERQIERALASKKDVSQNIIPTSVQVVQCHVYSEADSDSDCINLTCIYCF